MQHIEIRRIDDSEPELKRRIEELTGKPADVIAAAAQLTHAYFGAFQGARMIGFSVVLKSDKWILDSLFVHPEYRGQGIAGKLTSARMDFARKNGADEIWFCCSEKNTASLKSHRHYQFVQVRHATPSEAPEPSFWHRHIFRGL